MFVYVFGLGAFATAVAVGCKVEALALVGAAGRAGGTGFVVSFWGWRVSLLLKSLTLVEAFMMVVVRPVGSPGR